jgi:hypothetical protein
MEKTLREEENHFIQKKEFQKSISSIWEYKIDYIRYFSTDDVRVQTILS